MRARRQHDDWIWLAAELMGVLVLFGLISPQIRQVICAAGVLAVCAVSIAGTGLIGFGIYRFVTRSQWEEAVEHSGLENIGFRSDSGAEAAPDDCRTDRTTAPDEPAVALKDVGGCQPRGGATSDRDTPGHTAEIGSLDSARTN